MSNDGICLNADDKNHGGVWILCASKVIQIVDTVSGPGYLLDQADTAVKPLKIG